MFKENKRTCTEAIEFEDLREKTFPNTTNYFNQTVTLLGCKYDEFAEVSLVRTYRCEKDK